MDNGQHVGGLSLLSSLMVTVVAALIGVMCAGVIRSSDLTSASSVL